MVIQDIGFAAVVDQHAHTTRGIDNSMVGAVDDGTASLEGIMAILVHERTCRTLRSADPDVVPVVNVSYQVLK